MSLILTMEYIVFSNNDNIYYQYKYNFLNINIYFLIIKFQKQI